MGSLMLNSSGFSFNERARVVGHDRRNSFQPLILWTRHLYTFIVQDHKLNYFSTRPLLLPIINVVFYAGLGRSCLRVSSCIRTTLHGIRCTTSSAAPPANLTRTRMQSVNTSSATLLCSMDKTMSLFQLNAATICKQKSLVPGSKWLRRKTILPSLLEDKSALPENWRKYGGSQVINNIKTIS